MSDGKEYVVTECSSEPEVYEPSTNYVGRFYIFRNKEEAELYLANERIGKTVFSRMKTDFEKLLFALKYIDKQKVDITELKSELSDANKEIGILKSEIDRILNEDKKSKKIANQREQIKSLSEKVRTLKVRLENYGEYY